MSTRIMNNATLIYHRPTCHHLQNTKQVNYTRFNTDVFMVNGCKPCSCCHTLTHLMHVEAEAIKKYEKDGLRIWRDGDIIYVKTEVGFWKLIYSRRQQKILMYHRNRSTVEADIKHPERARFHRQDDHKRSDTIENNLEYIRDHDLFRKAELDGTANKIMFRNKKAEARAKKSNRKREQRTINNLFRMLETNDPSLKSFSIY